LPQTKGMMGATQFALMRNGSFIVNTSRGGLVDEVSLMDSLNCGHLTGAGLDVFQREPIDPNLCLLSSDKVVLTPHIGGVTVDSFRAMVSLGFENIEAFDQGHLSDIAEKKYVYETRGINETP